MSQFEARVSLVLFMCMATLITVNALFYQPAMGLSFPSSLNLKAPIFTKPGLVQDIQAELTLKGYVPGNAAGKLTLQTSAAILAYEHDNQLPLSGRESSSLLQHMLLGTVSSKNSNRPTETLFVRRFKVRIQRALRELGFIAPPGSLPHKQLSLQIQQFERERNLPLTGRISGRMLRQLAKLTGDKVS